MRRKTGLFMVLLVSFLLSACGNGDHIQSEGAVLWFRAVSEEEHGPALASQPYSGEELPQPEDLLTALLAGPSQEGLISPFPRGVTLRQCGWDEERPGVFCVNLSEQYGALADISLTLADYCIVLTLAQAEGVEIVEITAEGRHTSYRSHQLLAAEEAVLWDNLADSGKNS